MHGGGVAWCNSLTNWTKPGERSLMSHVLHRRRRGICKLDFVEDAAASDTQRAQGFVLLAGLIR